MFNNVILDVAMGIIFIFLVYSLLATSIQEAIATGLALRARTLKEGIINGMLCNTPDYSRLESVWKGVVDFLKSIRGLVYQPKIPEAEKKLGHLFYDHPLIKNYGASRIYPHPAYLPNTNFSTVLLDVLKKDFNEKVAEITNYKLGQQTRLTMLQVMENLQNSPDIVKIKELLSYYRYAYSVAEKGSLTTRLVIPEETLDILLLHLHNSLYDITEFTKKLEIWYDDSMNRVAGWYKRRVQLILFLIGIMISILFNVDIIQITGKLSTDKDAREQLVQLAIKEADAYKDDPRVKRAPGAGAPSTQSDTIKSDSLLKAYQQKIDEAKKTVDGSIVKANQLLALGWGDYGRRKDSLELLAACLQGKVPEGLKSDSLKVPALIEYVKVRADSVAEITKAVADSARKMKAAVIADSVRNKKPAKADSAVKPPAPHVIPGQLMKTLAIKNQAKRDSVHKAITLKSTAAIARSNELITAKLKGDFGFWHKVGYIRNRLSPKKLTGFLLTAFAICLGAPFWFDLLNKIVSLRGAGKKEEGNAGKPDKKTEPAKQPVAVNINTQQSGKEAVG